MPAPRRNRSEPDVPPATPAPVQPSANGGAQSRRLTKQVVFLMLIGWLVAVVLVVVVLSVT
jgi:hypothetical protein